MYNPHLYAKQIIYHRHTLEQFIRNTRYLMKWKANEVVMEVGCGVGNKTRDVILPLLPNNIKKYYAIDNCKEMLDYAATHSKHNKIDYLLLDVTNKNELDVKIGEKLDHILSFYCFHFLEDQNNLYKNLFSILKPGGDMLFKCLADSSVYNLWKTLYTSEKWGEYFIGLKARQEIKEKCISKESIENALHAAGFSFMVKREMFPHYYPTQEIFFEFTLAVTPYVENVPKHLYSNFLNDFKQYSIETMQENKNDGSSGFQVNNTVYMAYARKPDL